MRGKQGLAITWILLLALGSVAGCGAPIDPNTGDQPMASENTPSSPAMAGSQPQQPAQSSPSVQPTPQNPPTMPTVLPAQDPFPAITLPAIQFDRYHTQQEIASYFQAVAAALPGLAEVQVLGKSQQGRDVVCLVLNATGKASPPAIFFNGTHHGDEKSSTEVTLALVGQLLGHRAEEGVRKTLLTYALYFLPIVNPDGQKTADNDLFYTLSKSAAEAMGFDTYLQSYNDYPTQGEYVDYAYMRDKTLAITVEVSTQKAPGAGSLAGIVHKSFLGTMAFVQGVGGYDGASLTPEPETEIHYGSFAASAVYNSERLE